MEVQPWTDNLIRLEPPALLGSRCGHCDRRTFPAREVCPECRSDRNQEIIALSADGRLASYTVIRQAPAGVEVPYVLGYVDIPDDDVRLLSRIGEIDLSALRLGMPLRVELTEFDRTGDAVRMGWQFVPQTSEVSA